MYDARTPCPAIEAGARIGERPDHGILAGTGAQARQRTLLDRERLELARAVQLAVADVVHAARERVDRAHRTALVAGQQADAVEEVARAPARDLFTARVGCDRVAARPLSAHRPA